MQAMPSLSTLCSWPSSSTLFPPHALLQERSNNAPAPHLKAWQASVLRELDDLRAQVFMLWVAVGALSLWVCAPSVLLAVKKMSLRTTIAAFVIGVGAFESYRVLVL